MGNRERYRFSLPLDLSRLLPGVSQRHLLEKLFAQYYSHYLPQKGNSRDLQQQQRDQKAEQSQLCGDMHCFGFLRFHFQQIEDKFLSLNHFKKRRGGEIYIGSTCTWTYNLYNVTFNFFHAVIKNKLSFPYVLNYETIQNVFYAEFSEYNIGRKRGRWKEREEEEGKISIMYVTLIF